MRNFRKPLTGKEILRAYECYCYQIAFYLLGNERDAMAAAKRVLLELSMDEDFANLPDKSKLKRVRDAASIHSLHIRKNTAPQSKEIIS